MSPIVTMEAIDIGFKHDFKHASHTRGETESILVKVEHQGCNGIGEGCPRSYVTGESLASCFEAFDSLKPLLTEKVKTYDELKVFRVTHGDFITQNPALWCAVEMAFLDCFAQQAGLPVHKFLGLNPHSKVRYTAVVGITSLPKLVVMVMVYRLMGLGQFKLKLSGRLDHDKKVVRLLTLFGVSSIRVDANNLWEDTRTAYEYISILGTPLLGIEEPVKVTTNQIDEIAADAPYPLILDEHFTHLQQLDEIKEPQKVILNLRVSKVGGILNGIAILREARRRGIKVIMGAHVGETSLLTRASQVVACAGADGIIGYEGAFSDYLLKRDPVTPRLRLGFRGQVDYVDFEKKNGLGLTYD